MNSRQYQVVVNHNVHPAAVLPELEVEDAAVLGLAEALQKKIGKDRDDDDEDDLVLRHHLAEDDGDLGDAGQGAEEPAVAEEALVHVVLAGPGYQELSLGEEGGGALPGDVLDPDPGATPDGDEIMMMVMTMSMTRTVMTMMMMIMIMTIVMIMLIIMIMIMTLMIKMMTMMMPMTVTTTTTSQRRLRALRCS